LEEDQGEHVLSLEKATQMQRALGLEVNPKPQTLNHSRYRVDTHTHIHTHTYTHTHIHTYTHTHRHTHTHTCKHTYTHTQLEEEQKGGHTYKKNIIIFFFGHIHTHTVGGRAEG